MALNSPKPIQSWCVILQTFAKKNRKELVGELVRGFGLDEQEASDAISNLPIVVLDQLNLNQAKAIKAKLEVFDAEIEITNHDIIKKQCYRIEWPAQPDLSYFDIKPETNPPALAPINAPSMPALPSRPPMPAAASAFTPNETTPKGMRTPLTPKPSVPLPTSFPKPAAAHVEKNYDTAPLPKKSWFPFGQKKQPPAAPARQPQLKPVLKASPVNPQPAQPKPADTTAYQPKAPAADDANQSEWQKRTQEIQSRLEKIGAIVPEAAVKPSSRLIDKVSGLPPAKPIFESAPKNNETAPVQEKPVSVPEKKELPKKEIIVPIPAVAPAPVEVVKKPESLVNQSHELLAKIQKLEQELTEKKQKLEHKHAELEQRNQEIEHKHAELEQRKQEIEHKHRQVEEVQKIGVTFSEKVNQLEKALTEKEGHLNAKHSELEQKSKKEKALSESIAQLETQLKEKNAEIELRQKEILQINAQYEEVLKSKDQELELIQRHMQEIAQKFQVLEQGVYEKQDAITRKDAELQSKDQKIHALHAQNTELEKKVQEAQSLEKDKEQQLVGAHAREKEANKKVESLEKALVEIGESLRQRDEGLRQRDEVLVALERRVQDLAEKTGSFEALKATNAALQEEFEDVAGKYNRLSEEHRRLRSKNERKTATLTREMGEWVRKVDHLRQGLQKFNQNIVRPELSEDAEPESETPPSA